MRGNIMYHKGIFGAGWLLAAIGLMASGTVFAHGEQATRFVAPDGVDAGTCEDARKPCQSILYAIRKSGKGDDVLLAAGTYDFDRDESVLLTSDIIEIWGGYRTRDGFRARDLENSNTFIIGPDSSHRERLAERGLILIQDQKSLGLERKLGERGAGIGDGATRAACNGGAIGPFECSGIDLARWMRLSNFSSNPSSGNDIWGFVDLNNNREYAIIGLRNGTAVVDVTRPRQPREVGTINGQSTTWRDIKVYQFFDAKEQRWKGYAYVVSDATSQGLQIIDLTGLPFNISLANTYTDFSSAHNIYISNVDYATGEALPGHSPYAYILGSNRNGGAYRVLDIASDPVQPIEVTAPPAGSQYVHDATSMIVDDQRTAECAPGHDPCEIYIDFNESSVDLWDTTDKSAPVQISSTPYSGSGYTHSGWYSEDKMFIFIQDEIDELSFGNNSTLRTLDIRRLSQPFVSNIWVGPTGAIDHNGFVSGDKYYMSNYRRGLTILDIADPNDPQEIAFFDTYPDNNNASFNGAWGVFPYLPSGNLLVSDIERGLFILREQ